MHPVDSKDIAFQIGGLLRFKEHSTCSGVLARTDSLIEIRIPEDCMGKVMGDLSSRRGKIQGMDVEWQLSGHQKLMFQPRSFTAIRVLCAPLTGGRVSLGELQSLRRMRVRPTEGWSRKARKRDSSRRRNKAQALNMVNRAQLKRAAAALENQLRRTSGPSDLVSAVPRPSLKKSRLSAGCVAEKSD